MESQNRNGISLFRSLEDKGWFWENDCFYPPNKTFWFEGDDPPQYFINKLYLEMKPNLEKMHGVRHLYPDKERFDNWVADTKSLVDTLEALVEGNNAS